MIAQLIKHFENPLTLREQVEHNKNSYKDHIIFLRDVQFTDYNRIQIDGHEYTISQSMVSSLDKLSHLTKKLHLLRKVEKNRENPFSLILWRNMQLLKQHARIRITMFDNKVVSITGPEKTRLKPDLLLLWLSILFTKKNLPYEFILKSDNPFSFKLKSAILTGAKEVGDDFSYETIINFDTGSDTGAMVKSIANRIVCSNMSIAGRNTLPTVFLENADLGQVRKKLENGVLNSVGSHTDFFRKLIYLKNCEADIDTVLSVFSMWLESSTMSKKLKEAVSIEIKENGEVCSYYDCFNSITSARHHFDDEDGFKKNYRKLSDAAGKFLSFIHALSN